MPTHNQHLQPGELVAVQSLRADGTCYRWWQATLEQIDEQQIVTFAPAATRVEGVSGGWVSQYHVRAYYWFDRPYNLLEVYRADGRLEEVYVHIAGTARLEHKTLSYTDHELDVVLRPGQAPRVVDEAEFAQAAVQYGYSAEFQRSCWSAVAQAIELAAAWQVRGLGPSYR